MILRDKVIIISGVGPGMGRQLALLVAAEGAKLAIGARSQDFLESLSRDIKEAGGEVVAVQADVKSPEDCKELVNAAVKAFGRIDGLVNSAYAMGEFELFDGGNLDVWRDAMDVTCFGALRVAQAALPYLKKNGGSIVNIGSMVTRKPLAYQAPYQIGKAALQAASKQLAVELGQFNIRVNTTIIGWMWGPSVEGFFKTQEKETGASVDDQIKAVASNIPLGQIPTDQECARAVLFFLSDYSGVVTGATLDVNGGEIVAP
ncbi:MAG: oxidoreductase [Candidatus Marinimicrobia bacterium]|nr:oxidoreductase [Candidatus Neomarinimicrobiota bacterium]